MNHIMMMYHDELLNFNSNLFLVLCLGLAFLVSAMSFVKALKWKENTN